LVGFVTGFGNGYDFPVSQFRMSAMLSFSVMGEMFGALKCLKSRVNYRVSTLQQNPLIESTKPFIAVLLHSDRQVPPLCSTAHHRADNIN
jgi:hypothetical protein